MNRPAAPLRLLSLMLFWAFAACVGPALVEPAAGQHDGADRPEPVRLAERITPADHDADRLLIVHYHRPDGTYDRWNLWAWPDDEPGGAVPFGGRTEFGRYAVLPLDQADDRIGLIVRKGDWEAKDVPQDRFVDLDGAVTEIWLIAGEPRIFMKPDQIDLSLRLRGLFLDHADRITLATTAKLSDAQRKGLTLTRGGEAASYRITQTKRVDRPAQGLVYELHLNRPVAPEHVAQLTLEVPGVEPRPVYARNVLTADVFTAPDARLGPQYTHEATTFRTWSPVSESVEVLFYDSHEATEPARVIPMQRSERGVWSARVDGDLHGQVYAMRFAHYGQQHVVPDIHCFAATADSRRSAVIDLDRTDPEGWSQTEPPRVTPMTDEVLYEVHVRDYSVHDDTAPAAWRGKYLGLVHGEPGRGLDYLKQLGITAVHLLPVQDFGGDRHDYNWGYWTALFNVAESSYATEPHDPTRAPREFKAAIQKLHAAGIRVVMDVVYNHTATGRHSDAYDATVPYYWFRTDADGQLRNEAGTGNAMADERPMVRKYIVDSLAYWTREYKIDGYRFDLLGMHHPATVDAIVKTLGGIRDDLTLYGEPWTGGGPIHFPKGAQRGKGIAVFNDHLRNAIRGDLDGTASGFATGPGGDASRVVTGLRGAVNDFARRPTESINYVSAHDNLTLWDKIAITATDADDATRRDMQKLSLGIVLTAQGVPFLHGGSEFARTKGGNHNSYNAGDAVNAYDWPRIEQYREVVDYVRGLIALRKAHPAFRMAGRQQVRDNLTVHQRGPQLIVIELNGQAVGDDWSRIVLAYNGEPDAQTFNLPAGTWTQVIDAERAGVEPLGRAEGRVSVPGYSLAVWYR